MGLGYLKIEARTLNNIYPVKDASVIIKNKEGEVLYRLKTDGSGNTVEVKLEAPEKRRTLSPNYSGPYFAIYDVEVSKPESYITENIKDVQVYDTATSILPVIMIPKPKSAEDIMNVAELEDTFLYSKEAKEQKDIDKRATIDEAVVIPEYITVHLGPPNEDSKNIRVSFLDYIKNVASSEIYPTWPKASLEANIYAIITFTLHRLFTKYYRDQGYDFDITSSTKFDQAFVERKSYF